MTVVYNGRGELAEIVNNYRVPKLDSWKSHAGIMIRAWNLIKYPADDDEERIGYLVFSLEGEALKIAAHYLEKLLGITGPPMPLIYNDVVARLGELFLPWEARYKQQWLNCVQLPKEPLREYIGNKSAAYCDWWGEDNKFLISEIVKGIRNHHLKSLLEKKKFSSVQALEERALAIKASLSRTACRMCFRCGQPGHLQANCPRGSNHSRTRTEWTDIRVCNRCKTPGHLKRDCKIYNYQLEEKKQQNRIRVVEPQFRIPVVEPHSGMPQIPLFGLSQEMPNLLSQLNL